jgi:hypothetical protein
MRVVEGVPNGSIVRFALLSQGCVIFLVIASAPHDHRA